MEEYYTNIRPFSENDTESVAQIISESFKTKLGRITGIADSLLPEFLIDCGYINATPHPGYFVTERGGIVNGVIDLRCEGIPYPSEDIKLAAPMRKYGVYRVLKTLISSLIFHHKLMPGECYIEHIAVSSDSRGQGVGKELLKRGREYAVSANSTLYTLSVASENSNAIRLYAKLGFITIEIEKSLITRALTGISNWNFMVCRLGG